MLERIDRERPARLLVSILAAAGLLAACGGSDAPERGGAGADASDGSGGATDDGGAIAGAGGRNLDPRDDSAANAGAVYTYVYDGWQWVREAYLKPSHPDAGDQFGSAVSVSGGRIAVGARAEDGNGSSPDNDGASQAGAAYVFE